MVSLLLGLTEFMKAVITAAGYPGILLLMFVEGVITPIPSEAILPFAGAAAAEPGSTLHPAFIIAVATVGATLGAIVAYQIGMRIGRPLIERHGRWIGLGKDDIAWAERWFARYGTWGILIGHALPGIRSFISFPAGMGRMRLRNFAVLTAGGAAIWNSVLVLAGFYLGPLWEEFAGTVENVDLVVLVVALAAIFGYVYWRRRRVQATA